MNAATRSVALAVAAVVVLASGVWLTRAGRPHSGLLLNVHKLVDLAAVVVIGVAAYQAHRAAPLSAMEWSVLAAAAFFVIAAFASGGVVSAMQAPPVAVLWLHRVGSWGCAGLLGACVYLLAAR